MSGPDASVPDANGRDPLEPLVREWLAGRLDEAGIAELRRRLEDPAQATACAAELLEIQALAQVAHERAAVGELERHRPPRAAVRAWRRWLPGLAAAALMLGAALAWALRPRGPAEVLSAEAATVLRGGRSAPLEAGARLRPGDVLQTGPGGRLELAWRDRAGAATLRLGPDGHATLADGSAAVASVARGLLEASVAPRAQAPFVVATRELRAEVVGTRFAVCASAGWSEVRVQEGVVRVGAQELTAGRRMVVTAAGPAAPVADGRGLLGIYRVRADGPADLVRIDPGLDFDWQLEPPVGRAAAAFTASWSGALIPRFSEVYRLHLAYDDAVTLRVDGAVLVDDRGRAANQGDRAEVAVPLRAGIPVPIRIDYANHGAHAHVHLRWSSPSQPLEAVPAACLLPEDAP